MRRPFDPQKLEPEGSETSDSPDEADLWFLPGPVEEEDTQDSALPWAVAKRAPDWLQKNWQDAEAAQYRTLVVAAEAVARYAERLRSAGPGASERVALITVSALLRSEGIWLGPERIALYRALRLATDDTARDLSRADWAVRRLLSGAQPEEGVRDFLGRVQVDNPAPAEDHAVGDELDLLGEEWRFDLISDVHPLTRAAQSFALWRQLGLTPWDEMLEPAVAALTLGAGAAPFLPMAEGHRFDRHALTQGPGPALAAFLSAVEAGAMRGAMEVDRILAWRARAEKATADLSGRTPPALIAALVRCPILSGELAAEMAGCARPSARRNLALFADRGLIREVTGQARYRFWSAAI